MKKRLLILEQQSWFGGAQHVLDVVLESLLNDFDPMVALPDDGPFTRALQAKGIATWTYPLGTYRPGRKSYKEMFLFLFRSFICTLKLAVLIHKRRIALVYINGPRCLPAGALAAWLTRRPSVFHLHLVLARKVELLLVTRLGRRVTAIVACSQATAACLLNRDPLLASKTMILYSPVVLGPSAALPLHAPLRTSTDVITIGIVGRITPAKGQQLVLNAIAGLRPQVRAKIRLIVVGAPAPGCTEDIRYTHRLEEYAACYGLQEKILWAGYQPDPGPYYDSMDVLLHPSSDEALGLSILEALQRGIPVIASRTGGIPEIIRDEFNGLLVSIEDRDALLRSLERFLSDQSLRDRLVAGARSGIDGRFSPEVFKPAIRELITKLCSAGMSDKTDGTRGELATWK